MGMQVVLRGHPRQIAIPRRPALRVGISLRSQTLPLFLTQLPLVCPIRITHAVWVYWQMSHRHLVESPALKVRQVRSPRSIHPLHQNFTRLILADAPGLVDDHRMGYTNANPTLSASPEVGGGFWVGWLRGFHKVMNLRNWLVRDGDFFKGVFSH